MIRSTLHVAYRLNHSPLASFSLLDRYSKRKQKQEYEKQINFFLGKDTFTFGDYKQYCTETLLSMTKGVMRTFLSSADDPSEEELSEHRKILMALDRSELSDPSILINDKELREEVALVANTDVKKVDDMINSYNSLFLVHKWLKSLQKRDLPLPKNSDEMHNRFRSEVKPTWEMKFKQKIERREIEKKVMKEHKLERIAEKRENKRMRLIAEANKRLRKRR